MEEPFFARVARECGCKGYEAGQQLTKATYLPDRPADGDVVISDLLPSDARLLSRLQANEILGWLRCKCAICEVGTKSTPEDRDRILAEDIVKPEKKGLRTCFAIIALAGCLFAFRSWDRYSTQGQLRPFLKQLRHPGEQRERQLLFEPFLKARKTRSGIGELADALVETLRHTSDIFNIPEFSISGQEKRLREACNLPFMSVKSVGGPGIRPGKLFMEVTFDPDFCESSELMGRLFLKRITFEQTDHLAREDVEREIFNLQEMKRLGIDGVAELLLTFTTFVETRQHVHLIFNLYEYDLEHVLQSPHRLPAIYRPPRSSKTVTFTLSRHPLWEAALGLLTTVGQIHDPEHRTTGLPSGQILQGAHLDLKPGNIVISPDGKLLLIDWEHAVLNVHAADEPSHFYARAGTPSYRPPEGEQPETTPLRRAYDVWSLGCTLLEVMVFLVCITMNGQSVADFRYERHRETSSGEPSSVFWKQGVNGPFLKTAVIRKIDSMKPQFGVQATDQLKRMLDTNQFSRTKSLEECLGQFTSQGDLDELAFISLEERPIMPVRMSQMKVSFTTPRQTIPFNCDLQLYRSNGADASLTLVLNSNNGQKRLSIPLTAPVDELTFTPIAHYDPESALTNSKTIETGLRCTLKGLHRGLTLYFPVADDFRIFQIITTYQYPCLKNKIGYGLEFNSCVLRQPSKLHKGGKTKTYGNGASQLLFRLRESEYQKFLRENDAKRPSMSSLEQQQTNTPTVGAIVPTYPRPETTSKSDSKYRMVLYTRLVSGQETTPFYTCIVFNADRQDCIPKVNTSQNSISFQGNFFAALFEGRQSGSDPGLIYPGYPIDPDVLETATSARSHKICETVKLESLTLNMRDERELKGLTAILADKNLLAP